MNQRRRPFISGDFVDDSRAAAASSFNENTFHSRTLPAKSLGSYSRVDNRTIQPVLYDTPPVSTGQSYYQSISRSTPVRRPRPETAIPFLPEQYRQQLLNSSSSSLFSRSRASSHSLDEPSFYSVEEHHDALTLPSTTHQYSTIRRKGTSSSSSSLPQEISTATSSTKTNSLVRSIDKRKEDDSFSDVETLLALHLPSAAASSSSSSRSTKLYPQRDYSSSTAAAPQLLNNNNNNTSSTSAAAAASSTTSPSSHRGGTAAAALPTTTTAAAAQREEASYTVETLSLNNTRLPARFPANTTALAVRAPVAATTNTTTTTTSTTLQQQYNNSVPLNKPQVYRAEEREVERLAYHPGNNNFLNNNTSTSSSGRDSISRPQYPIVELSIPKSATHRSNSFDQSLTDYQYYIDKTDLRHPSNRPSTPASSQHHRNHSQPSRSTTTHHQRDLVLSPLQETVVKTSSLPHRQHQSSSTTNTTRSEFDSLSSSLNRSFYDQADSFNVHSTTTGSSAGGGGGGGSSSIGCGSGGVNNYTSTSTQSGSIFTTQHKPLDISSLDALLESAFGGADQLLDDDDDDEMSKSTKEWHSSFSSMRERFGNHELLDDFVHHFDNFTTNGSLTLPRRGLTKSASQGSMTLGRRTDTSTLAERKTSLLAEAVDAAERRASEATELIRRNSRQELGNFWAETVRNSSSSGTVQRGSAQMSAAQRLEMLHESVDMQSGEMRYSRGERIAARRAQFLKETIHSSNSSSSTISERAPTGRSTPVPNGYMNESTFHIDISENETTTTTAVVQQQKSTMASSTAASAANAPNFSALDNAVAELSTDSRSSSRTFTMIRSGGCARFPTGDLTSLSPTNRKDVSAQPHSPSPDGGSDGSSTYNAPSGLPHPKPKHNIREQLIQAGFELRGFSYSRSFGARFTSSPNFPVPSNGSVASRISEFEKRPGAPNLLQIACALTGISQRNDGSPAIRSPIGGPMSPRSSVYRTKPIIHADLGGSSPRPHTETTGSPTSVFQFPTTKQIFDVKEEVSYYNRESVTTKNEAQVTIISSNLDKVSLDSIQPRRLESLKVNEQNRDSQQQIASSSPTLAERRLEKNAIATLPAPLRTDAANAAPTSSSSSVHSPPMARKIRPVNVPRFYFPKGKPISMADNEAALRRVSDVFNRIGGKVEMLDMTEICKAAGLPIYWKRAIYDSCSGAQSRPITLSDFSVWWNRMTSAANDEASRFIYAVAGAQRNYIVKEDLAPILQDLIDTFPGLHFLREAQEFHARYVETVTVRIFWSVNRSWSGRITANELRRSNFLETVRKLETTDDINTITDYFSYEHFYVIYCKFYEIDKDHNLVVNKIDMSQHGNGAIPPRVIDRIFSGAVTRAPAGRRIREAVETINYTDFVAFLLAEEDKKHPTSIEYWFRVLDLDGDGFLSLYEMEYFYNGVKSKMDQHNIDSMRFDDVVCNLLDLVRPRQENVITLSDLKKCSMCTRFFNTFVNWVKYYEQESSEGERATVTDGEEELSDWDRYCLEEYEALMADDQENEEPEDINLNLDDDDDDDGGEEEEENDTTVNGTNVSTTVSMPLRDFSDTHHSTALEAL